MTTARDDYSVQENQDFDPGPEAKAHLVGDWIRVLEPIDWKGKMESTYYSNLHASLLDSMPFSSIPDAPLPSLWLLPHIHPLR